METATQSRYAPVGTQLTLFVLCAPFSVMPFLVAAIATEWQFWNVLAGLALVVTLVGCLRTSFNFDDRDVVIRNLFRTHRVAWNDVVVIEPSNRRQDLSDTLTVVTRERRIRALITLGPGRRGDQLVDSLHEVVGKRVVDRIVAFRPPQNPRPWSRVSSQWRPRH